MSASVRRIALPSAGSLLESSFGLNVHACEYCYDDDEEDDDDDEEEEDNDVHVLR